MTQPVIYMIAGPNGAGKTTSAMKLLPDFLSVHDFVNADDIARGLNPLNPAGQAVKSGRLMLERISDLIAQGKSFAFEATGASRTAAKLVKAAHIAGFASRLIYLWIPHPALAKQRVKFRVLQGGHIVDEMTIERRYKRSLQNLLDIYLPLFHRIIILDNTLPSTHDFDIIALSQKEHRVILNPQLWQLIKTAAAESN